MKKIILPLLLNIFFLPVNAQEDEGVSPKKPKFKPLQTGRVAAIAELPPLQGSIQGIKVNMENGLRAKASGLNIINVDPGRREGTRIQLRCGSSCFNGNNTPLLIVDGKIVPLSGMNSIDPNEIASIDILKKEKAGELYGAKGEFGAIIIKKKPCPESIPGKIAMSIQAKPFVLAEERLIVVDGVPQKNIPDAVKIERVDILKAADLYKNSKIIYCTSPRDVILITTKPVQVRTPITDRVNGQAVPYASVRLVFKQKNKAGKLSSPTAPVILLLKTNY